LRKSALWSYGVADDKVRMNPDCGFSVDVDLVGVGRVMRRRRQSSDV
jgi:hypothetical protein